MARLILIAILMLVTGYFFLNGRLKPADPEMPIFLRTDTIANNHHTKIDIKLHGIYKPWPAEIEPLRNDYNNLWAHLNFLYATNDVNAGKEYYTEGWFKQLCDHYEKPRVPVVTRTDESHELHIQNWDRDGLLCTAIDSNVILKYHYPDDSWQTKKANIAVVLLLQGDHWRIDAIRMLDEVLIPDTLKNK